MRVVLIHNPAAGDGQGCRKHLMGFIRSAGHRAVYQSTDERDWHEAIAQPADLVAVAGGDGTVAKVAKRMLHRGVPIAILPLGSANNIAKSLQPTMDIEALIAGWAAGRRIESDIGLTTLPEGSSYFVESVGIGLLADIIATADARSNAPIETKARHEWMLKLASERLGRYCPQRLWIDLDGVDLTGDYLLLEAMIINHAGPNLCLTPASKADDDLLDLVLVSEQERDRLAAYFMKPSSAAGLPVRRGRRLQVKWDSADWHIDDATRSGAGSLKIEVSVEAKALQFLVPG